MYRHVRCPTLIIRCTRSGAPDVLDLELRELASSNGAVTVLHQRAVEDLERRL